MNRVDQIFKETNSPSEFAKSYLNYLAELFQKYDTSCFDQFVDVMVKARKENRKVYFIGNGGSAATSSHFANDFSLIGRGKPNGYRAVSLTDNAAIITAVGNDDGYENIFFFQLNTVLEPGDVVVAISASGNSPNIVKALEFVKERGNTIVGISGFDGGKLKEMSDIKIHLQTEKGEYGPVEDFHMIVDHITSNYLMRLDESM